LRKIKRWLRAQKAERLIGDRREAVRAQVAKVLGREVRFKERGNLGHDSNYDVIAGGKPVAVLRLVNPHKQRPTPPPGMPFQVEEGPNRIAHEWQVLLRGAEAGITPRPLWHAPDALLCDYLPFHTLTSATQKHPNRVWDYLMQASQALHRLHEGVGIAHMDASLSNVIAGDDGRLALVDFEYTPIPSLSFAEQQVYDHLRLLQSSGKFIVPGQKSGHEPWFKQLEGYLDTAAINAPLTRIAPGLTHVLADGVYGPAIRNLLPNARRL
jgi:hypothetical protein